MGSRERTGLLGFLFGGFVIWILLGGFAICVCVLIWYGEIERNLVTQTLVAQTNFYLSKKPHYIWIITFFKYQIKWISNLTMRHVE